MARQPHPRDFIYAFWAEWLTAMSGGLSAIFAIAAYFITSTAGKELFGGVAVLCFLVASYRIWASENQKVMALQGTLHQIGLERCLGYHNSEINLHLINGLYQVVEWHIVFENLSSKMIKYTIDKIWLRDVSGNEIALTVDPNPTNYINADRDIRYTCVVANGGYKLGGAAPFTLNVGFEISYDNVPPINTRVTEQEIQITIVSINPASTTNRIVSRVER